MNGKYKINNQKMLSLFYFLIVLLLPTRTDDEILIVAHYVKIITAVVLFLLLFINVEVQIKADRIIYSIKLIGITIFIKNVSPELISEIVFKRVGWYTKCAVVKLNKGINFRVISKTIFVMRTISSGILITTSAFIFARFTPP